MVVTNLCIPKKLLTKIFLNILFKILILKVFQISITRYSRINSKDIIREHKFLE